MVSSASSLLLFLLTYSHSRTVGSATSMAVSPLYFSQKLHCWGSQTYLLFESDRPTPWRDHDKPHNARSCHPSNSHNIYLVYRLFALNLLTFDVLNDVVLLSHHDFRHQALASQHQTLNPTISHFFTGLIYYSPHSYFNHNFSWLWVLSSIIVWHQGKL